MFCVSTELTGEYHKFRNSRMDKFPMTPSSTTVYESGSFKVFDEFSYLTWHLLVSVCKLSVN